MQISVNLLHPKTERGREREFNFPPLLVQLAGDFARGLSWIVGFLLVVALIVVLISKLLVVLLVLAAIAVITGIGYSIRNPNWIYTDDNW